MHLYRLSGILLIVPIVDFALAVPVKVQENRQARPDMADILEYPISMLGKRGKIEEVAGERVETLIPTIENYFGKPEVLSAAKGPSSSAPSEAGHVSTNAPAPNPGPSTQPPYVMNTGLKGPLSSSMFPKWFHSDNMILDVHGSQPIPADSGHRAVTEEPSSPTRESPTGSESSFELVGGSPSGSVSSTDPSRESMSADPSLENIHTDSDSLKGRTRESRRNSGTAEDVGDRNAAQREFPAQLEKSRGLNEPAGPGPAKSQTKVLTL